MGKPQNLYTCNYEVHLKLESRLMMTSIAHGRKLSKEALPLFLGIRTASICVADSGFACIKCRSGSNSDYSLKVRTIFRHVTTSLYTGLFLFKKQTIEH
jgi:hypothetical protein